MDRERIEKEMAKEMNNPNWKNLSCQKCVENYPYLKMIITDFAEDIIKIICKHNSKNKILKGKK